MKKQAPMKRLYRKSARQGAECFCRSARTQFYGVSALVITRYIERAFHAAHFDLCIRESILSQHTQSALCYWFRVNTPKPQYQIGTKVRITALKFEVSIITGLVMRGLYLPGLMQSYVVIAQPERKEFCRLRYLQAALKVGL